MIGEDVVCTDVPEAEGHGALAEVDFFAVA